MPISALIVTLPEEPQRRRAALEQLARDPRLTLGPRHGLRLAMVADTRDPREDAELFDALQAHAGLALELVSYDFSDSEPEGGGRDGAP